MRRVILTPVEGLRCRHTAGRTYGCVVFVTLWLNKCSTKRHEHIYKYSYEEGYRCVEAINALLTLRETDIYFDIRII